MLNELWDLQSPQRESLQSTVDCILFYLWTVGIPQRIKYLYVWIYILWNNQQMQLYAVNFIPLLGSLYMFRVFYTPIIRSTIFNCIYSHCYKP